MKFSKFTNIKDEEKFFTTKYMTYKYNFTPVYIDSGIDIPDCYFEFENKFYAVEVTRYFQQNSEKEHQEYVNLVEKYFENNFFKEAYHRLGRRKAENVTISFYNVDELKNLIINNSNYIKNIFIGNNYYLNEKKEKFGDIFIIGNKKEKMMVVEFINSLSNEIYDEEDVEIELFTKNKYDISIKFKYCKFPYYGKNNDKKVIPVFCWFVNDDELYNNIINIILHKNKKLINEYIPKFTEHNIKYDNYNLVVYNEGIPADLDEEKLFSQIKKIDNLKYQEIAIFLWKKVMVISNNNYQVFHTK